MSLDELLDHLRGLTEVDVLIASEAGGHPEVAWGDAFCTVAPVGRDPDPRRQPFATVVTKDYPGFDEASALTAAGGFRLNVSVGAEAFATLVGRRPGEPARPEEPAPDARDRLIAHPVHGLQGWVAVVDPGPRTDGLVREVLAGALARERARLLSSRP